MAESFELAKKVKIELEKRLEEINEEKSKLEANFQANLKDLDNLKTENDRIHAEQMSFNQVCSSFFSIDDYIKEFRVMTILY